MAINTVSFITTEIYLKNNASALKEQVFVKVAIQDVLDRGLIEMCTTRFTAVNPLSGSVQNNWKKAVNFRHENC